jgi:hypothetical protein
MPEPNVFRSHFSAACLSAHMPVAADLEAGPPSYADIFGPPPPYSDWQTQSSAKPRPPKGRWSVPDCCVLLWQLLFLALALSFLIYTVAARKN